MALSKEQDMGKKESTVSKYDLVEMLDRNKTFIVDLQDFAIRNQAEVTMRVLPNGNVNFQVIEKTDEAIYWKSFTQDGSNYKYEEAKNKR